MYINEAYNMVHAAAQQETKIQVIRKVHHYASTYQRRGEQIPLPTIAARTSATRPLHAPQATGCCTPVNTLVDSTGRILQGVSLFLKSATVRADVQGGVAPNRWRSDTHGMCAVSEGTQHDAIGSHGCSEPGLPLL